MSDSNEEDRTPFVIPVWLFVRMIRNAHLYNKAGRLAEMKDTTGVDLSSDEAFGPGLVGEIPPLKILLLSDEARYVHLLVSADLARMIAARDHGVSHGMRGYEPPDLQVSANVLHSLEMARTSATIEAMEALEEQRADTAALAEAKPGGSA